MVSGLNEAVCHEEPVVSGSKAQSSVVSYSSKTDSDTKSGVRTSVYDMMRQEYNMLEGRTFVI